MSGFYMLGRLLWRPASWLMLLALAMVSFTAGLDMAQGPQDLLSAGLYGEASRDQRLALWRLATMLPAFVGLLPSFSARELQHTFFAWTLPGLQRGLRTGKALIGSAVALLIALFAARMMGPWIAAAAFGWALLCFTIGGVAFDPVRSKVESKGVVAILALLVYRADYLEQLVLLQPLVVGAIAVLAAATILRHEFSLDVSRVRPLFGIPPTWTNTPHGTRQFWSRSGAPSHEWSETLANDSFLGWLRAGYHEAYGGVRGGGAGVALLQIAIITAAAFLTEAPHMVVVMSWIALGSAGAQLRARFLYPIARSQRAMLFFISTALETLAIGALALIAAALLFAFAPLRDVSPSFDTFGETATFLAFFIAWAPLGHWAKIREPWTAANSPSVRLALRFGGFQVAYIILAMGSAALVRRITLPSPPGWVAAGLAAAVIYALYWLAIRRHHQTSDLIFARR